jgi:hypothetical protein
MSAYSLQTQVREIHYPGGPWSVDEMEHIPLLHPVAKQIREELSATNKTWRDIELQNQQQYFNFIARFNSDLVFRLIVTQNYYQLSILFKDPRSSARWAKFLDEVRAYERHQHQKQIHQIPELNKNKLSSPTIHQVSYQELFHWTHPDPSLSNTAKWQHYEQQLQHITFNYHAQRAQIHNNAFNAGINRIDNVLAALRVAHGEGYRMGVDHFEALRGNYNKSAKEIMDIPLHKRDGTYDIESAMRQDKEMETLTKTMTLGLDSFFRTYGDSNQIINNLHAEHECEKTQYTKEINEINSAYKEQNSQLNSLIQAARTLSKSEIDAHLNAVLLKIRAANLSNLDTNQQEHVANLIETINDYRGTLKTTDDAQQVQQLLAKSIQAINETSNILPEAAKKQVQLESAALEKMVTFVTPSQRTENQAQIPADSGRAPADEPPNTHKYPEDIVHDIQEQIEVPTHSVKMESAVLEEQPVSPASFVQEGAVQQQIAVEQPVAPVMERRESSEPMLIDSQEGVDASKPTHAKQLEEPMQVSSVPDSPSIMIPEPVKQDKIDHQRDLKSRLTDAKNQNGIKILVDKPLHNILAELTKAEKIEPFNEEQGLVDTIRALINNTLNDFPDYKEIPPEVKTNLFEVRDKLEELVEQCSRLSKIVKILNPLIETLGQLPEEQNTNKMCQN